MNLNLDELERVAKIARPRQMDTGLTAAMAAFISTFSPIVALELIEEIRRLRAQVNFYEGLHE